MRGRPGGRPQAAGARGGGGAGRPQLAAAPRNAQTAAARRTRAAHAGAPTDTWPRLDGSPAEGAAAVATTTSGVDQREAL